jgi:hypothetical protein
MFELLYHLIVLPYPIFRSLKALSMNDQHLLQRWMCFWCIFSLFKIFEGVADLTMFWFPFYSTLKLLFVLAMEVENFKIPELIYNAFVRIIFDVIFTNKTYASRTGSYVGKSGSSSTLGNLLGGSSGKTNLGATGVPLTSGYSAGNIPIQSGYSKEAGYPREVYSKEWERDRDRSWTGSTSNKDFERDRLGYKEKDSSYGQQGISSSSYGKDYPKDYQGSYNKDNWSQQSNFANKDLGNVGYTDKSSYSRATDQSIH